MSASARLIRLIQRVPLVYVGVLLATSSAAAGTISLSLGPVAEIRDGVLIVQLSVLNGGDQEAASVTPALHFRARSVRGRRTMDLEPDGTLHATLTLPAEGVGTGRWPYRVTADYTDGNLYAFQALRVTTLTVGSPPPAQVAISEIKGTTIADEGALSVEIKNLADVEHTVAVQIRVPSGLEVAQIPPLTLLPREERRLSAPIANHSVLAGSRLPVFVTIEYDDGETHHAAVRESAVEIRAARLLSLQELLSGIVIAFLLLAGAVFIAERRRAPKEPS